MSTEWWRACPPQVDLPRHAGGLDGEVHTDADDMDVDEDEETQAADAQASAGSSRRREGVLMVEE